MKTNLRKQCQCKPALQLALHKLLIHKAKCQKGQKCCSLNPPGIGECITLIPYTLSFTGTTGTTGTSRENTKSYRVPVKAASAGLWSKSARQWSKVDENRQVKSRTGPWVGADPMTTPPATPLPTPPRPLPNLSPPTPYNPRGVGSPAKSAWRALAGHRPEEKSVAAARTELFNDMLKRASEEYELRKELRTAECAFGYWPRDEMLEWLRDVQRRVKEYQQTGRGS